MLLGAIEAGGTKFVCAIGNENGEIFEKEIFETTTPNETLDKVTSFFKDKNIESIGLCSFGPIDLNKKSKTYGYITSTPKPNWENFNILGYLQKQFDIPINFDTDVNGSVVGEVAFGAARGLSSALYLTVGTGVGAGIYSENSLVHGMTHPEAGHILIKHHPNDNYLGNCPFHSSCLEGMASGPAIEKRYGIKAIDLPQEHEVWDFIAYYIAQGVVNYILIMSPEKIILGGGVMKQKQLLPMIQNRVQSLLNGFIVHPNILESIDEYIVPPKLGDHAGICGALALAKLTLKG